MMSIGSEPGIDIRRSGQASDMLGRRGKDDKLRGLEIALSGS